MVTQWSMEPETSGKSNVNASKVWFIMICNDSIERLKEKQP